jgi:flagellar biosynthesis protein FliR
MNITPAPALPSLLAADPTLVLGVVARMAAAVAAGGLPVFPRLDLRVRAVAVVALAAVALPAAVPVKPGLPLVPLVAGEAVVGFGLGLAAAIVFAAAAWAGGILGNISGLNWADDFNPDAPAGEGGAARLAAWLAVAGFLAAGGHLAIVASLVDSVQRLPVGLVAAGGGLESLVDLAAEVPQSALNLAISLAAPATVAVVSFHLAAAICLRAVRFAPGAGLLQAAASLVLLAAVFAGASTWTHGFAAAARRPLEEQGVGSHVPAAAVDMSLTGLAGQAASQP